MKGRYELATLCGVREVPLGEADTLEEARSLALQLFKSCSVIYILDLETGAEECISRRRYQGRRGGDVQ